MTAALRVADDFVCAEATGPGSVSGKPRVQECAPPDAESDRGLFFADEIPAGKWGIRDFGAGGRTG
ncbi:hypothetical protein GCM10018952_77100 [Streptosporangium vulgare]